MKGRPIHRARISQREALLFEAGIKLGGVFHQFLGTPVSRRTAPALERSIEAAVGLQPYVRSVRVAIDPGPSGRGRFGYRYLHAEMLRVDLVVADGPVELEARLAWRPDLAYPLMSVQRLGPRRAARPTAALRSART